MPPMWPFIPLQMLNYACYPGVASSCGMTCCSAACMVNKCALFLQEQCREHIATSLCFMSCPEGKACCWRTHSLTGQILQQLLMWQLPVTSTASNCCWSCSENLFCSSSSTSTCAYSGNCSSTILFIAAPAFCRQFTLLLSSSGNTHGCWVNACSLCMLQC